MASTCVPNHYSIENSVLSDHGSGQVILSQFRFFDDRRQLFGIFHQLFPTLYRTFTTLLPHLYLMMVLILSLLSDVLFLYSQVRLLTADFVRNCGFFCQKLRYFL